MSIDECCPRFDPTTWEGKLVEWNEKKFIKDSVFTFFHIPINFGGVMARMIGKTEKAGVLITDYLCLSDHTSRWNMDVYLAVDREVEGAQNVRLSGKHFAKVYEGSFSETGKWCEDFKKSAETAGRGIDKMYMWYTTCPKCAQKYGKNYVVIIGKLA